eukprot:NODE_14540_length_1102_cov_9.606154.p1 GENE.NODE_14540_length_1102_cov_9.606154~~NODE_14540_length_1102_cov_9.606154.p1  ORF type:complete len:250 (-),score=42.83 NODE_14540_length_1102_cov_9.606154:259-1008(-)
MRCTGPVIVRQWLCRPTLALAPLPCSAPRLQRLAPAGFRCAGAEARRGDDTTAASSVWPQKAKIFDPVWNSPPPVKLMYFANSLETFFCLRHAQKLLGATRKLGTIDDINRYFIGRFLELHKDVEQLGRVSQRGTRMAPWAHRLDLATISARTFCLRAWPAGVLARKLVPMTCAVLQGRQVFHHGQRWLQVTTSIVFEEKLTSRDRVEVSRMHGHFVVFDCPRDGGVEDFRIAEVRPDVGRGAIAKRKK